MGLAGSIVVELLAKTGSFETDVGRATKKARKDFKDLEQSAASLSSGISKIFGGLVGGLSAGAIFGKFIIESRQAQDEQAQLAAVLQSTGNAAGYTAQQLNAMATSLSGKSVFGEGDINRAQTRLLSYTNIVGDQFPRALQSAIDTAQRLGVTVEQAAETVGKALDIPSVGMASLSKQGFKFTEDQKKVAKQMEETGNVAGAQAIVLQALESSYGGAAEAARQNFGGSISALGERLNSLMTGGDGTLNGAARGINNLTDALGSQSTQSIFTTFTNLLGDATGGIADLAAEALNRTGEVSSFINTLNRDIDTVKEGFRLLNEAAATFNANFTTDAAEAGGALSKSFGESFIATAKELDTLSEVFTGTVGGIERLFSALGANIENYFSNAFNGVLGKASEFVNGISSRLSNVSEFFGGGKIGQVTLGSGVMKPIYGLGDSFAAGYADNARNPGYANRLMSGVANRAMSRASDDAYSMYGEVAPGVTPKKPGPIKTGPDKESEYAKYLKNVKEQIALLGAETEAEKQLALIQMGKYGNLSVAQQENLLQKARTLDAGKLEIQDIKDREDALADLIKTVEDETQAYEKFYAKITGRDKADQFLTQMGLLAAAAEDGLSLQQFKDGYNGIVSEFEGTTDKMSEFAVQAARDIQSNLGDSIYASLTGQYQDLGTAFKNMLLRMASDIAASQISELLLGQFGADGGKGKVGGLFGFLGGALKIGSMFTGNAGAAAPDSITQALAGSAAYNYDSGGFTGSGGKYDPAGIVHRGEYVFSAQAVKRLGVGPLERLHRGYSDGGWVGGSAVPSSLSGPQFVLESHGVDMQVVQDRENRYRIIAREEADSVSRTNIDRMTPSVLGREQRRPNSPLSKAQSQKTNVQRNRR